MILERGNMWSVFGKTDLFLLTTNPIRRKDGAVVMGRGIAKEAKDRFPRLPYDFGYKLQYQNDMDDLWSCGPIGVYDDQMIGYFMVKDHWRDPAKLSIIERSVFECVNWGYDPSWRIDLNFPGIGNGKLRREDVLPLLEELPDNYHVWEYG